MPRYRPWHANRYQAEMYDSERPAERFPHAHTRAARRRTCHHQTTYFRSFFDYAREDAWLDRRSATTRT
jgi:hypothetical protein